jgi:hypothetical protein
MSRAAVKALATLLDAARKVPIARHDVTEPYFTCLGCKRTGSKRCKKGCWVQRLENAIGDAEEAIAMHNLEQFEEHENG